MSQIMPQRRVNSGSTPYNATDFQIRRALAAVNTAEPVRVVAVYQPVGPEPVGFVDVVPLINQVDGDGKGQAQSTQYKLPYQRIQGGKNALIIDPLPGDIGLAVYAQRDTETWKETRPQSGTVNPGSARRQDKGDGLYFGGFLNGKPERWVWVRDEGIDIEAVDTLHSHGKITVMDAEDGWTVNAPAGATINAPDGGLTVNGDVLINGSITWTGTAHGRGGGAAEFDQGVRVLAGGLQNHGGITDNGTNVGSTHTHTGVQPGDGNTGGPQ